MIHTHRRPLVKSEHCSLDLTAQLLLGFFLVFFCVCDPSSSVKVSPLMIGPSSQTTPVMNEADGEALQNLRPVQFS